MEGVSDDPLQLIRIDLLMVATGGFQQILCLNIEFISTIDTNNKNKIGADIMRRLRWCLVLALLLLLMTSTTLGDGDDDDDDDDEPKILGIEGED